MIEIEGFPVEKYTDSGDEGIFLPGSPFASKLEERINTINKCYKKKGCNFRWIII